MAKVDNNFLAPRETFFGYLQELLNPEVQEEIWGDHYFIVYLWLFLA
jgi:hypothetical protein